jgi:hypothetical protein
MVSTIAIVGWRVMIHWHRGRERARRERQLLFDLRSPWSPPTSVQDAAERTIACAKALGILLPSDDGRPSQSTGPVGWSWGWRAHDACNEAALRSRQAGDNERVEVIEDLRYVAVLLNNWIDGARLPQHLELLFEALREVEGGIAAINARGAKAGPREPPQAQPQRVIATTIWDRAVERAAQPGVPR